MLASTRMERLAINFKLFRLALILVCVLMFVNLGASKRNYRHSKREIELTKVVNIQQKKCKQNETPIFVHSAAQTAGKYYNRRQATRMSWAKEAKNKDMRVFFVIGLPADNNTQRLLEKEAKKYKDILQFGFRDDYYNLTLKAISILRWAAKHCSSGDYIIKTDDDVIVNVDRLRLMLDRQAFGDGITGRMLLTNSNRRMNSKWFMPERLYPSNYYQFLYGFSYVMSTDVVPHMYETVDNYTGPVLDIDDLFMTGVIADEAGVRRHNSYLFGPYCYPDACALHGMLVTHGCANSNQTMALYNAWKRTTQQSCRNRLFGTNRSRSYGMSELLNDFISLIRRIEANDSNANNNNNDFSVTFNF